MYEAHPDFEKPDNENEVIWRYLDFTKFVSLLEKKALFFSKADLLGDPFEGSYPEFNIQMRPNLYKDIPENAIKQISENNKKLIQTMFVNCWHLNEFESAAMWKLYLQSGEGVAVRSTFKKLTKSFSTSRKIQVGKVKYIDYEKYWMPEGNAFYPFLHKRESFRHENELRAIFLEFPTKNNAIDWSMEQPLGFHIDVDLGELIEEVHTFPTASEWFHDMVTSVSDKYGLPAKKISKSKLNKKPVY